MTHTAYALRDLSGGGRHAVLTPGTNGGPLHWPYDGERYLAQPGWDDESSSTPIVMPDTDGVEVRLDHDQAFIGASGTGTPDGYCVIHQGDNADLSWALYRHHTTGALLLKWTDDGTTITTNALGTPPGGTARTLLAFRLDSRGGTLDAYWLPAGSDIERPLTEWRRLGAQITFTPTILWRSALPLSISGFDEITGAGTAAALGAYYRAQVFALDGTKLADLDPSIVPLPLTDWTIVTGENPSHPAEETNVAPFPGGAGETWTFHHEVTFSMNATFVDRACVVVGNESRLEAVDGPPFDAGAADSITVAVCFRNYALYDLGTTTVQMAHVAANTGWQLLLPSATDQSFSVSDGADFAIDPSGDVSDRGAWAVLAGTLDRDTDLATAWLDTTEGAGDDASAVGSITTAAKLLINSNVTGVYGSGDVLAAAVWPRALTADELPLVVADWLAGGLAASTDDYAPFLATA